MQDEKEERFYPIQGLDLTGNVSGKSQHKSRFCKFRGLNADQTEIKPPRIPRNRFTEEGSTYAYADPEKMYELLGFARPAEANSTTDSTYWIFKGTAKNSELDALGIAHAKWLNISIQSDPADKTLATANYLICDRPALSNAILSPGADPTLPDVPLTLHIEGENVLLNPLLTATETTPAYQSNNRHFELMNDKINLASGKVFHISYMNISHYAYSDTAYVSLSGWLLTPEAE